jgi:hypothetical protein
LAALLLYRAAQIAMKKNPLDNLHLPPISSAATNAASATNAPTPRGGVASATNNLAVSNAPPGTNALAGKGASTNAPLAGKATNATASAKSTNATPPGQGPPMGGPGMGRPMGGPGMRGMGGPPGMASFPPAVQGRIDRIIESEILGPVPRPMPMALLGIGGKFAFVRAPSGQTDLMSEGGEMGGLKMLRIGTNRVLVEHEGQQKELTIFSGFGSESLLPKGKDNPQ